MAEIVTEQAPSSATAVQPAAPKRSLNWRLILALGGNFAFWTVVAVLVLRR